MAKFQVLVGVNYALNNSPVNHDLNADSPHQVGAVIGKLIEEEPDAINFIITVVREDAEDEKSDP
jgi:hypothetical protein